MKNKISHVFSDGVILTRKFIIVSVGKDIFDSLGYSKEQFLGMPLSSLTGNPLRDALPEMLKHGSFEGHQIEILTMEGRPALYSVSGFHLGLISELNDLVVLKFRNANKDESITSQLNEKNAEMDEFIYFTSHGLRGPLATVKGLINLLKIHQHIDQEHTFIVTQMSHFADQLDDRLHKLMYFVESDKTLELSKVELSIGSIAEKLRGHEDPLPIIQKIDFNEHFAESETRIQNGELILTLLQNIKSFFCRNSAENVELSFRAASFENFNEFELVANGISLNEKDRKKIDTDNFGYTEILSDPEFTDLYAAKKIALKLQARMKFRLLGQSVHAHIIIPRIAVP